MNTVASIIKEHIEYGPKLLSLAYQNLRKTYSGSLLSWAWAIIRPSILIFTFWFAFTFGLRAGSSRNGFEYILWLMAGMIPWYYMRDMLSQGSNSLRKFSYLVNRVKFPVSVIPTIVSLSFTMMYVFMTVLMVIIFLLYGHPLTWYMLQIPLYWILMFLFFTAWGLFSSMLTVISRDFYNLVRSLTQAIFWLSGILYEVSNIDSDAIRKVLMWNPVTLLANGFRNALIWNKWLWEEPTEFWHLIVLYVIMAALAVWAYNKLREEIPDLL